MRRLYHITIHIVGKQVIVFITERQCNTCEHFKTFDEFTYDNAQNDGYAGRCTECKKEKWNNAPGEEKTRRKAVRKASEDLRREDIRAYDRLRHNTDEHRTDCREKHHKKREVILLERELNPPPPKPIPTSKICPKCEPPVEKPLDEFNADSRRRDKHGVYCKECMSKYYRSEDTKAKAREYRREKMETDPTFYKRVRQGQNQWRKENPLSQLELTLRRNARKKSVRTERVSYKKILQQDGRFCYICEKDILPHHKLEFDHVIPLIPLPGNPQGTHSICNIHPAHKECNRRKGNKRFEDLTKWDRRGVDY